MRFILDENDFTVILVSNKTGRYWVHNLFNNIRRKWPTYETKDHHIFISLGDTRFHFNLFNVYIINKPPVFIIIHERFDTYIEALDFMESYINNIYLKLKL